MQYTHNLHKEENINVVERPPSPVKAGDIVCSEQKCGVLSAVFHKVWMTEKGPAQANVGLMSSHVAPSPYQEIRVVKATSPTSVSAAGVTGLEVMKEHDLTQVIFFDHIPITESTTKSVGPVNATGFTQPVVGQKVFGVSNTGYEAAVGEVVDITPEQGYFTWKPHNRPTFEGESGMPIVANVRGENIIVGRHVGSEKVVPHNMQLAYASMFTNDCRVSGFCGDGKEPSPGIRNQVSFSNVQDEWSRSSKKEVQADFLSVEGFLDKPGHPHPATLDLVRRISLGHRFVDHIIEAQPIQNTMNINCGGTPQNIEKTKELIKMIQGSKAK